jgi:hypothetical protein
MASCSSITSSFRACDEKVTLAVLPDGRNAKIDGSDGRGNKVRRLFSHLQKKRAHRTKLDLSWSKHGELGAK